MPAPTEQWLRNAIDLQFYVEKGYLVVQAPTEAEAWYWRQKVMKLLEPRDAA